MALVRATVKLKLKFVDRSNPGWVEAEPLESLGCVEAEAGREVWGPPR